MFDFWTLPILLAFDEFTQNAVGILIALGLAVLVP